MDDRFLEEVETWTAEGEPPVGRSGHRILCTDAFLYCVGGYHPALGPLQESWRLNLSTLEWEQLSDPSTTPSATVSHCLVSGGGHHLLTLGGTSYPFGALLTNSVEVCHMETGEWTTLQTTGEDPPSLYGQAARRVGDYVYTVGGTSGYHFSLHAHALHLPSLTWTRLAKSNGYKSEGESLGRYRAEVGVCGRRLVVVGGADADTVFPLDELPVLDMDSGRWSTKRSQPDPNLHATPSPRRSHAAVQRGQDLYVVGGTDGVTVFDDVWRLHLPSLTWTRLKLRLPTPLFFHDAALTKSGTLYVYGGRTSVESKDRSSAVYRAPLQAPPLLEAAWGAFTSHCSTLTAQHPTHPTPHPAYTNPHPTHPNSHPSYMNSNPKHTIPHPTHPIPSSYINLHFHSHDFTTTHSHSPTYNPQHGTSHPHNPEFATPHPHSPTHKSQHVITHSHNPTITTSNSLTSHSHSPTPTTSPNQQRVASNTPHAHSTLTIVHPTNPTCNLHHLSSNPTHHLLAMGVPRSLISRLAKLPKSRQKLQNES